MADLVSIIVRTQGRRPRLLRNALDSLVAQTWPALEIILVEDGGDTLGALAEELGIVHLPIAAAGRCGAGNAGLARATGALLGFLDDDDQLEPNHVSLLATALAARPEVAFAYARARPEVCYRLARDEADTLKELPPIGDVPFSRALLWLRNAIPMQAALFRRSLYEQHGGFDPALDMLEDWDLWLRYTAEGEVIALDAVTSRFRMPAEKDVLVARAAQHAEGLAKVRAKHRDRVGLLRFEDVTTLPERIRGEIPFRHALGLAWRALGDRLKGVR